MKTIQVNDHERNLLVRSVEREIVFYEKAASSAQRTEDPEATYEACREMVARLKALLGKL